MQIAMNFQVELLMGRLSFDTGFGNGRKNSMYCIEKRKMLLISEILNGVKDFKVHWGK